MKKYKPKGGYSYLMGQRESYLPIEDLLYRVMSFTSYGNGEIESMREELNSIKTVVADIVLVLSEEAQDKIAAKNFFYPEEDENDSDCN